MDICVVLMGKGVLCLGDLPGVVCMANSPGLWGCVCGDVFVGMCLWGCVCGDVFVRMCL